MHRCLEKCQLLKLIQGEKENLENLMTVKMLTQQRKADQEEIVAGGCAHEAHKSPEG